MGTDDTNTMGFFITGGDESYRCLFYKNRTCHVREQIGITDENLKKSKVIKETFERAGRDIQDAPPSRRKDQYVQNTADWLVNNFCRICPHREA